MGGSVQKRISLFGEELSEDTLTFRIYNSALETSGGRYAYLYTVNMEPVKVRGGSGYYVIDTHSDDLRNFRYGAPVILYNKPGGTCIGNFYLLDVKQVSKKTLEFTCTDGIGMIARAGDHAGGIYNGTPFLDVLNEIMMSSGVFWGARGDLTNFRLWGRLPYASKRQNLADLLIATGATVTEEPVGMIFQYLPMPETEALPKIYLKGNKVNLGAELATEVQVVEHSFYALASDEVKTLFDNTGDSVDSQNQLIIFEEPYHNLAVSGSLTISESNANYAIVSGRGVLTGKEYTHNTHVISRPTGLTGTPNIKILEDNQLIGLSNSANVSKRMAKFYSTPISATVECLDEDGTLEPGEFVSFVDAFGTSRTGCVRSKSFNLGNKTKAHLDVLTGWSPGPFGESYNAYKVFRQSDIVNGRITFPSDMVGKQALIMLFGGAQGGQGGYDGEDGEAPSSRDYEGKDAAGGFGGQPGNPGERGNVLSVQVDSLPAYYDNASIGIGGEGGERNGGLGALGTATTLGSWSSAQGSQMTDIHVNLIDGTAYGVAELTGYAGADGGTGRGLGEDGLDTSSRGGSVGISIGGNYANGGHWSSRSSLGRTNYYAAGQGGGGAARGNNGGDAEAAPEGSSAGTGFHSRGGNGADAIPFGRTTEVRPGRGGNGGGGGGGSCLQSIYGPNFTTWGFNEAGKGGLGSEGGPGGNGLILIYYMAA